MMQSNSDVAVMTMPYSEAEVNLALSMEEQFQQMLFEDQLELMRDRVRSVALGYHTGAYLVGRPGAGKTQTVIEELERLDVPFTCRNSRMTSKGLFRLIETHPEHTLVLDDIPSLMQERYALQTLLAALGGKAGEPRTVTLTTAETDGCRSTEFCGGIIAISNVPLRRDPLADAVQSRVPILEHEPTDEMLIAAMRAASLQGYKGLSPKDCLGVVDYAIDQMRRSDYRIDLRIRTRALEDYRLWKDGKSSLDWKILVNSTIKRVILGDKAKPTSKPEEIAVEKEVALKILVENSTPEARNQAWTAQTNKSIDTFYRRVRELKAEKRWQ